MKGLTNSNKDVKIHYIQPLSSEYKQLSYIESDGLSYIDTDVMAVSNMSCDLEFEFVEIPYDGCLIGTKRNGGNRLYFYHYFQGHRLGYGNYLGSGPAEVGTRYKVNTILNQGFQELKINDNVYYSGTNNIFINNKLTYYIFDLNSNNTDVDKYKIKAKLYYCKIWEGSKLVRDFIPVKRLADNKVGLFDLVESKFYDNLGSGSFSGNDSYDSA